MLQVRPSELSRFLDCQDLLSRSNWISLLLASLKNLPGTGLGLRHVDALIVLVEHPDSILLGKGFVVTSGLQEVVLFRAPIKPALSCVQFAKFPL